MRGGPRAAQAIVLAIIGLLPCGNGAAQAGRPDSVSRGRDTLDVIPLATVRVTVLRTPLSLGRVPYAVTVERSVEPTAPGLTLAEVLGSVPGLQVDNRYNFSQGDRIAIRGFGARSQFGVRGVKVQVDGIPATMPDGQTSLSHVDPWMVARSEVVRGPVSSVHGNAAGGVILMETLAGGPGGPWLSAATLIGGHGLRHQGVRGGWTAAAESGGPGAGLSIDATASLLDYSGFRDHASADKAFGSARISWQRSGSTVDVVAHGVSYDALNPGSLSAELMASDRTQAYAFNVTQGAGEAADQVQAGIRWSRTLTGARAPPSAGGPATEGLELELSAWAMGRRLDNPIPPAIIDLDRRAGGLRAMVRGVHQVAGRSLRWAAGLDAGAQWDDRRNHENEGGERGVLTLAQDEGVRSVAPFVELTAPAGPVDVVAGLRYDRYRFEAVDHLVTADDPDDSGSRRLHHLSPSVGVVAHLGATRVFANASSAFETPTTTELVNRPSGGAGLNPDLDPQRAWSVEAGVRTDIADRVVLHASAFRVAIRDALIPFEVPDVPGRSFFRNAGEATHRGLELDAWTALGPARLRVGYAWLDARFDRFVTEAGDWSGNRVPGVSPHRVHGGLTWNAPGGARAELRARYVDRTPANDANTAAAPAYAVLDLGIGVPLEIGEVGVEIIGGVDNLADREYVTSVVVNAFGGRYYEPGPGRSAHLGLRTSLGGNR
jgi:iron complex outermembrane receptor protein